MKSTRNQQAVPYRLRVLVIDEEFPYPPNAGKRIRSWNLLRRLAARHQITWLCFGRLGSAARQAAADAGIEVRVVGELPVKRGTRLFAALLVNCFSPYPYSVDKHFREDLRREVANAAAGSSFDLIHVEWGPYARYLEAASGLPSVVAAHNVESQIWQRRSEHAKNPLGKFYFAWQARKMRAFERSAFRSARIFAVSEQDRDQFLAEGLSQVDVVENGVDVEYFQPVQASNGASLLFLASLDWFPNQDALNYFLDAIFPLIRQQEPSVALRVVGRRAPAELVARSKRNPGVEFIGEVDDVRGQYREAALVLVPLRIGGGSRLKILEAMAAGTPVVSTTIGAEGITATPGKDIVLADTPADFARETIRLMRDPDARIRLAANARQLVVNKYSWDSLAKKLEDIWQATVMGMRP
jgi:polysaccharide biosynthesis protein PslH